MTCRDKFRVVISKQHIGYFDNMTDKMLTNKCNYLESLVKITMECVIAAKAEGVDITEGKEVDIDLEYPRERS
jgi:hypothetical protein